MKTLLILIGLGLSLNTLATPTFLIPKKSGISLSGAKVSMVVPHRKFILKRNHKSARVIQIEVPAKEFKTVCIKRDWREVHERNGDECGYDTVYEERCNQYCSLYHENGFLCLAFDTECHNEPVSKPRKCHFQKKVCVETEDRWKETQKVFPIKFDLNIKLKKRDITEEFLVEIKTSSRGSGYISMKALKTKNNQSYKITDGYLPTIPGSGWTTGLRVSKR